MERLDITTEYDPAFILLCLGLAALYTWLLYSKQSKLWNKLTNRSLSVVRFIASFLLAFLLLNPLLKYLKNTFENPVWVIAIDNSLSMKESKVNSMFASLNGISEEIVSKKEEVEWRNLDGLLDDEKDSIMSYKGETRLHDMLTQVKGDYESRNLAGLLLLSDGIVNSGLNPEYGNYNFPIYTIGLGDTTQKPDAVINNILVNKLSYQGNFFPVSAEVIFKNLNGSVAKVGLYSDGKLVEERSIEISEEAQYEELSFKVKSEKPGFNRIDLRIQNLKGETNILNNQKSVYVEVVEGKDKVLLVAPSPHPDIKAIRSAINNSENYELTTYIYGIDEWKDDKYDVVIFYQAPDNRNRLLNIYNKLMDEGVPAFHVLGSQSNKRMFNDNGAVNLKLLNPQSDFVFPTIAPSFNLFSFEGKELSYASFPPVTVPFADYTVSQEASVLLYQKVGNINTDRPLWVLHQQEGKKSAVMVGEGFWKWRLQSYVTDKNFVAFDELLQKTIQFLSARDDKRKFKVYPTQQEVELGQAIEFETELYNDLYERVYEGEIALTITREGGAEKEYQYQISEGNTRFRVTGLTEGVYSYKADLLDDSKNEAVRGKFLVKELKLELTNLVADHNLLRRISDKTGGQFFKEDQMSEVETTILDAEVPKRIHSQEEFSSLLDFKWVLFLLLFLVSLEWFIRKYLGSY